ncbi:uncharacterized protein LOC110030719 [Phalaenopsis equestris]|uniref:uncharacterized protein LOC110030719 n=1 Tax=Phalaenopsis equestris TaxID=78828 RepID=UPI0009E2B434|nr:uncharacterized protein LOC110030719 [Phalaenopsis equestris]
MSAVAASVDQSTDLLQNLSVETKSKGGVVPVVPKKPSAIQYGPVNAGQAPKVQMPSLERFSTPVIPGYMDPNMYFIPNGYPSTAFYYGGYDGFAGEWDDYNGYLNTEAAEISNGVYGEMYHHGYGYSPYSSYPWSASVLPAVGDENISYGSQHYQYPSSYYQYQGEVAADQPSVTVGSDKSNSNTFPNGISNANSGYFSQKNNQQSLLFPSNDSYGRSVLYSSFDGMRSPFPWYYGPTYAYPNLNSATPNTMSSTASQNFHSMSTRNQNGLNCGTTPSMGQAGSGTLNRFYPTNLMYGQYGNPFRDCAALGSQLYNSRMNFYGFYGRGYENFDGMSELNRGPRVNRFKILNGAVPTGEEVEDNHLVPNRDQYNRADFPEKYADAKFFIIKSYSEDDIHRSIKYGVWASTPGGNKKLDSAYKEAMNKADGCPVFLFFSVNTSGQFVGAAEMVGPVDFDKTVDYWQQEKWIGCFNVKWHIVKDVPNSLLRHITLEYNDNKPVTNSRDTQEVKLEQGLQVLKILKDHVSKTSILDDFGFYETRQKVMQEKRARQHQHNQQFVAVKSTEPVDEKDKETADSENGSQKPLESAPELKNSVAPGGGPDDSSST